HDYPDKVYKVEKALYGLHQAPRACQDKYIDEILRKFKYEDVKPASTQMDKENALLKDLDGDDVNVHLYRSMIGSLMYLTSSRPDIMFAGHPKLGLWYPKDSSFDLVAYTYNDYAGASLDKKSTSGGYHDYPDKVYKVEKALYGLHQAPRACQDKYIDEILRKFKYEDVKPASTQMDKENALLKDLDGDDVNVHLYRSMIGSLMYLTSSRPDIMFALWRTASVITLDNKEIELNATFDGQVKSITKATIRRHLKLADADGISTLPTTEIFEQLDLMGYVTDSDKLTF
nr:putative ribonuclease H-like domain-containing protein [Tanacetum cinerariifolium]